MRKSKGLPAFPVRASPMRSRIRPMGLKHPRRVTFAPTMVPIAEVIVSQAQQQESELAFLRRRHQELRQRLKEYRAETKRRRMSARQLLAACAAKILEKDRQIEELQRQRHVELNELASQVMKLRARLTKDKAMTKEKQQQQQREADLKWRDGDSLRTRMIVPEVPTPVSSPDSSPEKPSLDLHPRFVIRPLPPVPPREDDDVLSNRHRLPLIPPPPPPKRPLNRRGRQRVWSAGPQELQLFTSSSSQQQQQRVEELSLRLHQTNFDDQSHMSILTVPPAPSSSSSSSSSTATDEGFSSCHESTTTTTSSSSPDDVTRVYRVSENLGRQQQRRNPFVGKSLCSTLSPTCVANHRDVTRPSHVKKCSNNNVGNGLVVTTLKAPPAEKSKVTVVYWKGPYV